MQNNNLFTRANHNSKGMFFTPEDKLENAMRNSKPYQRKIAQFRMNPYDTQIFI